MALTEHIGSETEIIVASVPVVPGQVNKIVFPVDANGIHDFSEKEIVKRILDIFLSEIVFRELSIITKIRATSHRFGARFWLLYLIRIIVL